jgi:hypothetical protein
VHYKSFKKYVGDNFREDIIDWQVRPTEDDHSGYVLNVISKFLS